MESGGESKSGAASEDIRTRRKHAKQQKKLEKKKKKEEEFLRDLRKPKDTKVVLADRGLLERLANGRTVKSNAGSFEFSTSDFPELSRKPEPTKTATHKAAGNAALPPVLGSSNFTEAESVPKEEKPEEPPASGVVVNLGDLIVTKAPKKGKKQIVRPGAKIRRKLESNTLCGNMLDSSNPKRSRGKHRETEKRTFTKLKLAIIRDRILSLKGRDSKTWVNDMDREKFKLELDMYLSDLMKKLKVAKEERAAKANKTTTKASDVIAEGESAEPAKKGKAKRVTKYRKYCDNAYSEDLDKAVNTLVQGIVFLQDRAYGRNPIKGKAKPRHVVGLREIKKCLMLHKVKMLIIAPDLEAQDTVFNTVDELKKCAEAQNVPCVFALSRRHLGYSSKKSVPVSAFGILYYDGLEDKFAAVTEKLQEAKDKLKTSSEAASQVPNIPQ